MEPGRVQLGQVLRNGEVLDVVLAGNVAVEPGLAEQNKL